MDTTESVAVTIGLSTHPYTPCITISLNSPLHPLHNLNLTPTLPRTHTLQHASPSLRRKTPGGKQVDESAGHSTLNTAKGRNPGNTRVPPDRFTPFTFGISLRPWTLYTEERSLKSATPETHVFTPHVSETPNPYDKPLHPKSCTPSRCGVRRRNPS